jgi:hypothetical protein
VAGRKTLLTDELRERIEDELASGAPQGVVAQRLGVAPRSLGRWLAEGRVSRPEPPPPEPERRLLGELPERLAAAEPALVARVAAAADRGSWVAASWLLERGWPERWAKREPRSAPPL